MSCMDYELIRNRYRNTTEDEKIRFISSKQRLESRTWLLTTMSLSTILYLIEFMWHSHVEKQDNQTYTTTKDFKELITVITT